MRQLPKAIPELDGGLFLPRQVVDLIEVVLAEHETLLQDQPGQAESRVVLRELRELMRLSGKRAALPSAREQLGLEDPERGVLSRNLLRG